MPETMNDLWNLSLWPASSPEMEVRARIRSGIRTRRITRQLPALALVVAGLSATMPVLFRDTEQAADVRTAADRVVGQDLGGLAAGDVPGTSPSAQGHDSSEVPFDGVTATLPGGGSVSVLGKSSPPPRGRATAGPLLVDPEGDASYDRNRSICEEGPCTTVTSQYEQDSRSTPSLDILSGDMACTPDIFRVVVEIDDLAASLPADQFGNQVESATYGVFLRYDGGQVALRATRLLVDGSIVASGEATTYEGGVHSGKLQAVDGVAADFDERAGRIVLTAAFSDVQAAQRAQGGTEAHLFRSGVIATDLSLATTAVFEKKNHAQQSVTADTAGGLPPFYLCD